MASRSDELVLTVFLHPWLSVPFNFVPKPFRISAYSTVEQLMDCCEYVFNEQSQTVGMNLELQINVLWNIKDQNRALDPLARVGNHFETGDTFGVYGDIQPQMTPSIKPEEAKIPVTILTGFLGSGKTTLLNYILQEQKEKKIAVIENEFGEIPIDDALLQTQTMALAEKIVVMDNGCMCCTIRGDLIKGLTQILDEIHRGKAIDAVIIETTGMADPVPIVRTFKSSPEFEEDLRLDAVITMADAKHLPARLDDFTEKGKVNEAYQQVAFSDKIILNKLDLITPEQAIACKDRIRNVNKYAKILPAVRGRVKISELVNIRAHDMANFVYQDIEKEAEVVPELAGGQDADEQGFGSGPYEDYSTGRSSYGMPTKFLQNAFNGNRKSRHNSRVNSFSICKEGEINSIALRQWMQFVVQLPPQKGTVFRIKAILAVKDHPYKLVFHSVMDVTDEDDAGLWTPGEKKISKIVFIGKSLDQQFLTRGFESMFER